MTNKKSERAIQQEIVIWLRSNGYKLSFSTNNEAMRTSWSRFASVGALQGAPDLIVAIGQGINIYFEVKNEVGRMSEAQLKFKAQCDKIGQPYYTVRSLLEVQTILAKYPKKG